MCEEFAVTLKSGVLNFRHAYLCVQSSQVMLGKVIKLVILKPYRCNFLEYVKGHAVALK